MKKILFIIATALVIVGCEKKEYWERQTPENPVIAHLMCIEFTKAPTDYTYGITLINAQTGSTTDRFSSVGVFNASELPIKFYTKGGQRLDREKYLMVTVGINANLQDTITYVDSIPEFRSKSLIYKGETIGLPTEYAFGDKGIEGKWYFRFD